MDLTLANFRLTISPDGQVDTGSISIQLGMDMCVPWLRIALDHLYETEAASELVGIAHREGNGEQKAEALRREFSSGMQAIMASSIAMDAFYASVQGRTNVSESEKKKWIENRTARYKQVAVAFRFYNAKALVGYTINCLTQIIGMIAESKNSDLENYNQNVFPKLVELANEWSDRYDALFDLSKLKQTVKSG